MKTEKRWRKALCLFVTVWMMLTMPSALAADGVDWERQIIVVTGMGIAPPNAVNITQGQMLAKRAAVVDGYRQLAEQVKGVNVDAESTVENMMVVSDVVRTKVSACIQGARILEERMRPDGVCEVTMSIPMFGVSNPLAAAVIPKPAARVPFPAPTLEEQPVGTYTSPGNASVGVDVTIRRNDNSRPMQASLQPMGAGDSFYPYPYTYRYPYPYPPNPPIYQGNQQPSNPQAPPVKEPKQTSKNTYQVAGNYTSLVVDCTGLELQPAMSPVIRNENGEAIYGASNLDYDIVTTKGMAAYSRSLDVQSISRAGERPFVVKGTAVSGNNINPVVTVADANHILMENEQTHFLDELNVIFVR